MTVFLVEDPELSQPVKALQKRELFGAHGGREDPLFQLQKPAVVDPSQNGKEETAKESFLFEQKTAVEVDEDRLPLVRDEDVSLMSQVQVDHASRMDFPEDLLQTGEERRRNSLSPLDWFCINELHGKGETVNPLYGPRYVLDPSQPGVYLPFFMNQPEAHCPSGKGALSPDVLNHESPLSHLHLKEIRFSEGTSSH